MQGFVRVFRETGFGFIVVKDTRQIYFHASHWLSESIPAAGDYVSFEIGPAKNSRFPDQAINVRKINVATSKEGTDVLSGQSTTEVK
jgi:cold shock CspA family protein